MLLDLQHQLVLVLKQLCSLITVILSEENRLNTQVVMIPITKITVDLVRSWMKPI